MNGIYWVIQPVALLVICNDVDFAVLVSERTVLFQSLCRDLVDTCADKDEIHQVKWVNEICNSSLAEVKERHLLLYVPRAYAALR